MRYVFCFLLGLIALTGCYFDHKDLVYPQTSCSVTGVTYSKTVTGILTNSCYSCHSGAASAGAGIRLDNYTSLKVYVTNGQLMNSIAHTGGIPGMPLNGSQLSSCEISTIQAWITNGAPNN